jgi:hypothetical protein
LAFIGDVGAGAKIKINVRQSDAAIRQQLLQLTPPGTSAEEVFHFLQFRLERERNSLAGALGEPFQSAMSVTLGHYYELRTFLAYFFPFPTVVQAFWDFDEHDKLRDIRIQRLVHGL